MTLQGSSQQLPYIIWFHLFLILLFLSPSSLPPCHIAEPGVGWGGSVWIKKSSEQRVAWVGKGRTFASPGTHIQTTSPPGISTDMDPQSNSHWVTRWNPPNLSLSHYPPLLPASSSHSTALRYYRPDKTEPRGCRKKSKACKDARDCQPHSQTSTRSVLNINKCL